MTTSTLNTSKRSNFPLGTIMLVIIVLVAAGVAVYRFAQGLGAATNLSDTTPWGLWIGLDVMSGVALAAGGFTLAGIVYVFRIKRFYPLLRPTLLTAYIGYMLAAGAILFDLGRPERFYHPFFFWNIHSVMFEIAWSVLTYLVILTLENSALLAERFRLKWLLGFLRKIVIPVVILGIIISTMHQSSLGALFLLMPQRVHPLWYTAFLPVLFYISAIMVGLAMVIIESSLSASAFGREREMDLLSELGGWIPWVMLVYVGLRFVVLLASGKAGDLFAGDLGSMLFWIEMLVGIILPAIILVQKKLRSSPVWLFRAAVMVTAGVIINRFNILFFGQGAVVYAPSWMEFAISAGFIAFAVLLYMFTVKNFRVLDDEGH